MKCVQGHVSPVNVLVYPLLRAPQGEPCYLCAPNPHSRTQRSIISTPEYAHDEYDRTTVPSSSTVVLHNYTAELGKDVSITRVLVLCVLATGGEGRTERGFPTPDAEAVGVGGPRLAQYIRRGGAHYAADHLPVTRVF